MLRELLKYAWDARKPAERARRLFDRAVKWNDNNRHERALAGYRRVIALDPHHAQAYNNLAVLQAARGAGEQAITLLETALRLQPDQVQAHMNLAGLRTARGELEAALNHYERAMALAPGLAPAEYGRATALLALGRYEAGWAAYESRWRIKTPRTFSQPRWNGNDDLRGRRILLYTDQGFGDALQFIRYAPLVAARGAHVIVQCHPALGGLFRRVAGVAEVVTVSKPVPDFDCQLPLLSLPLALGTTLQTIPSDIPYVSAHPDKIAYWGKRTAREAGALKIGLAWAGNPAFAAAADKACPIDDIAALAQVPDCAFFSLQIGAADKDCPPSLTDFTADIHDFEDTAALISCLDMVITIDTAVAHLAGALGKPVWLMLGASPDWRWRLPAAVARWYPTARLFPQRVDDGWHGVVHDVRSALHVRINRGATPR